MVQQKILHFIFLDLHKAYDTVDWQCLLERLEGYEVGPVMSWAESGLKGDAVGKYTSLFYANNDTVGSQDLDWLQSVNQHLCNLFHNCIGL